MYENQKLCESMPVIIAMRIAWIRRVNPIDSGWFKNINVIDIDKVNI